MLFMKLRIRKMLKVPASIGQIKAFRLFTQPRALAMRNCGRMATTLGNMLMYMSVQKILSPPLKFRRSYANADSEVMITVHTVTVMDTMKEFWNIRPMFALVLTFVPPKNSSV